jgi:predicted membrane-bound spermidine synthase
MTKSCARRALVAAVLVVAAVAVPSASASSVLASLTTPVATLAGTSVPCANRVLSTPFAAWGDSASYFPVAGGSFESGAAGWTLTGGASLKTGGEPFLAGSSGDALDLPSGSTATAPGTCIDLSSPTVRAFMVGKGSVTVSAIVGSATFVIGTINPSSSWAPTPVFINTSNLLSVLSTTGTVTTLFRFTATSGDVRIDDVYVDPYRRT